MFDHLSLAVRDLEAARRFYDAFFAPLGVAVAKVSEQELAYGPGGTSSHLFLYPVAEARGGPGVHTAFAAADRAAVDAAYAQAVAQGAQTVRAAGAHPDIAPDYYGAVILDPDGNKLEVVAAATMH